MDFARMPAQSVCIADTDLEAEVDPSVETEEKLRAEEQAARQRLEAMQRSATLIGWNLMPGSNNLLVGSIAHNKLEGCNRQTEGKRKGHCGCRRETTEAGGCGEGPGGRGGA